MRHKADGRTIDILVDEEESVSGFGRIWLMFGLMVLHIFRPVAFAVNGPVGSFMVILFPFLECFFLCVVYLLL